MLNQTGLANGITVSNVKGQLLTQDTLKDNWWSELLRLPWFENSWMFPSTEGQDTITAGGTQQGVQAGLVRQDTVELMRMWGVSHKNRRWCARAFLLAQTELLCGRLAIRRECDRMVDCLFQYMVCGGTSLARLIWPSVNVNGAEQVLVNWQSRKRQQPERGAKRAKGRWIGADAAALKLSDSALTSGDLISPAAYSAKGSPSHG